MEAKPLDLVGDTVSRLNDENGESTPCQACEEGGVGERYLLEEATEMLSSATDEPKPLDLVGDTVSRLSDENGD